MRSSGRCSSWHLRAASMVTGAILPVDGGNLAFDAGGSLPTFSGLPSWRS